MVNEIPEIVAEIAISSQGIRLVDVTSNEIIVFLVLMIVMLFYIIAKYLSSPKRKK